MCQVPDNGNHCTGTTYLFRYNANVGTTYLFRYNANVHVVM